MNLKTKIFLKKRFKEHYWKNPVLAPPELYRREFGVGTLDDKIKFRHRSFKNEKEFRSYMKVEAPFFISCSSAYYEFPANQPMGAKSWLGADLVFDLDCEIDYLNQERFDFVRKETMNLVDFLIDDFGFNKKDLDINFSGSKGYHIHIRKEDVRVLSGDERREIVDYITGTSLNQDCFMHETVGEGVVTDSKGTYSKRAVDVMGPMRGDPGWGGRIYNVAYDIIANKNVEELRKIPGIGEKTAKELIEKREKNIKSLETGHWGWLQKFTDHVRKKAIDEYAVTLMGDADRMVTIDTARLMRIPDTLHGGTGMKAARVKNIETFNPLDDAVVFSDEKTKLSVTKSVPKFEMKGEKVGPYRAGEVEVPEFVAVYLLLTHAAEM